MSKNKQTDLWQDPEDFKLLFLDIETSPNVAYVWGLFNQNVAISQIEEPTKMLTWAAKWANGSYVEAGSSHDMTEYHFVKTIYDLVNEADAVCHYNGVGFDMKHLNREFAKAGLPPPMPYKNIDLLKVVRKNFRMTSNKLDFVLKYFGLEPKASHEGFGLWKRCMDGDDAAFEEMIDYNIKDVEVLEDLYYVLLPWIHNHPNVALWVKDADEPTCPNCGSTHLVKKGVERPAQANAYQRYRCMDCGKPSRGRTIVSKAGKGVLR